ncbi:MAG: hypothetical protein BWY17_04117 [Deltaproteobacteria bacterium ADurb.Bin207]|jgi:hypothetical protein|nr:MAG: hypothetical protein BWY17_04117 [Deltaproteobacteria bacterium ADurb.Bin207]
MGMDDGTRHTFAKNPEQSAPLGPLFWHLGQVPEQRPGKALSVRQLACPHR